MNRPNPQFRAFFDILATKSKPNLGLLARLRELADYGFFEGAGDEGRACSMGGAPQLCAFTVQQTECFKMHFPLSSYIAFTKTCFVEACSRG